MEAMWQDIRYGLRLLARSPGFTAIVFLVIGVGIGVTTALFDALDQVYARSLPVQEPHNLVSIKYRYRAPDRSFEAIEGTFSYPAYEALRDQSEVFVNLMAFSRYQFMDLRVGDEMVRIQGTAVSVNYFSALGIRPALGRLIAAEWERADDTAGPVVVISHALWRSRFGAKTDIIGKPIVLDGRPLTVIGVAAPGFSGTILGRKVDAYFPLGTYASGTEVHDRTFNWLYLLGSLRPDIHRAQAQAALRILIAHMEKTEPDGMQRDIVVSDGSQGYVPGETRAVCYPLGLALGVAVLVSVIACANIANLQLARAAVRQREIAVRRALGAGHWRIIQQLLIESVLLASIAGLCGILLALGLSRAICAILPRITSVNMDPAYQVRLNSGLHPRTLLFAVAVSLATGIAFGLAPALQIARWKMLPALQEAAARVGLPARRRLFHDLLVAGQIAIAVPVMVCSGLCLRSLAGLGQIDLGYDATHILVVSPPDDLWPIDNRPDLRRFFEDLQERVSRLPGVASASLAETAPASERSSANAVSYIEGVEIPPKRSITWRLGVVGPGYFHTLGQSLLTGRDFTANDDPSASKVLIINETVAKRYWPNQDPIGKEVAFYGGRDKPAVLRRVIGVVANVKLRSILEESVEVGYLPLTQDQRITPLLLVRIEGRPHALIPTIRREIAALEAPLACEIHTVAEQISGLLLPQRVLTGVLDAFGFAGLLLAATGIYAVTAYTVSQRSREIGIRMALGACGRDVLALILRKGAFLMALGLVVGLVLSLAGARVLASLLPAIREWDNFFLRGVPGWDPLSYLGAALVITVVTLLACFVPACRAARIDPIATLRCE